LFKNDLSCESTNLKPESLNNAENAINTFIERPDFRIWLEDEEGNRFVPKGKIKVNYIQKFEQNKER